MGLAMPYIGKAGQPLDVVTIRSELPNLVISRPPNDKYGTFVIWACDKPLAVVFVDRDGKVKVKVTDNNCCEIVHKENGKLVRLTENTAAQVLPHLELAITEKGPDGKFRLVIK
ncbi:hypothetical protein A3K34_01075 [candidate division WWE3 bacterium RIFOXYC1_FULL_40_10]|uniref:Uncharacterized protein n=1 Tax=candidate division WWE3 bacterium RIFOXYA2_FULL_46_9 TaxID=1802636 RepID=A0A1F4W208_UNCKA|nr:MAG: hypothetical protein A3K58_01075 [candidate division WWE3 bacterium RIFOXYB1_FULL_40_22]OGC61461.1 MAG: hypothetical protein A3K37_01075 [candidate division WWE3 bacterium RIFOXYA1_FULL_40_11]OGC63395.1 MAG: hypothetical protein A2264_01550 [candidate division WWE3 bacterium RIFOXYA2_FULL_46_9]OGC64575.1 MAG: hypothetical protein A2326_03685 [candidate division WWE3 bacterium RIFOXYB2_FULL_41_6]OGC65844.1 MAG: hypothetical protein A3K34_01075 [candidate division WWE3 bacterium RIFOXYC1_